MRELEASLQQSGEFLLRAQLVKEKAAPFCVRWVRRFLTRPASSEPLADQVCRFCEELNARGTYADWQVRQAEQALRIYFVNFLNRTDWRRPSSTATVGADGTTETLAALAQLRLRIRTRHYSYRTECTYVDWARRFLTHVAAEQHAPRPRVDGEAVRTTSHTWQCTSASRPVPQNQALSALLFLCRDVLGLNPNGLAEAPREAGRPAPGGPERPGNGRAAVGHAGHAAHHGTAHLRRRPARLGMLRAAHQRHRL